MSLWVRRWKYEMYREASAPGIWMLKVGGYYVRTSKGCKILRGVTLEEAVRVSQQMRMGTTPRLLPTFGAFALELFAERVTAKRIDSESTKERWNTVLTKYLIPAFGPKRIDLLMHLDIIDWVKTLAANTEIAASTKNLVLRVLRSITNAAFVRFDLRRDPCLGVENFPEEETYTYENPNSLPPEMVREFLARAKALYPQHYAMMLLGFVTGRRPGELRAIDRNKDINWDKAQIIIRRSHSRGRVVRQQTKTGTPVILNLPESVMEALREHVRGLPEGDLLFPNKDGELMSRGAMLIPFRRLAEEVGVKYSLTPRAMRRSFQDLARAAGVAGVVTRSISGHRTAEMTDHYSTVADPEQRAALNRMLEVLQ